MQNICSRAKKRLWRSMISPQHLSLLSLLVPIASRAAVPHCAAKLLHTNYLTCKELKASSVTYRDAQTLSYWLY